MRNEWCGVGSEGKKEESREEVILLQALSGRFPLTRLRPDDIILLYSSETTGRNANAVFCAINLPRHGSRG